MREPSSLFAFRALLTNSCRRLEYSRLVILALRGREDLPALGRTGERKAGEPLFCSRKKQASQRVLGGTLSTGAFVNYFISAIRKG
jgi:hypothetical protein